MFLAAFTPRIKMLACEFGWLDIYSDSSCDFPHFSQYFDTRSAGTDGELHQVCLVACERVFD